MRIDGTSLADRILSDLSGKVSDLKSRGITPTLAVILSGDDPGSLSYIRQKQKKAEAIGASVIFDHQPATISKDALMSLVTAYNADPKVHGLIIQRPVPPEVGDVSHIIASVKPEKDVDGFVPDSPFEVPVAMAVGETLRQALRELAVSDPMESWISDKYVAVIGRGSTAGAPILRYFEKLHCTTSQIHSQTPDPASILVHADVIVSCVGKDRVITRSMIKRGAILIGVGLWRGGDGKLKGDYDEADIQNTAAAYTPTPGGIGPVNVACLMQNLVRACILETGRTLS